MSYSVMSDPLYIALLTWTAAVLLITIEKPGLRSGIALGVLSGLAFLTRVEGILLMAALPLLHLVQAEQGYVSADGTTFCAETLGLTKAQVAAVKKVMAGPKASDGRQVYPGYLWDTGITNTRGGLPGVLVGPPIPEGPTTATTMNVDAEAARALDGRSMAGDSNAWTNLSTFRGHGGKLVFLHGVSDPWFSAQETVRYYELLGRDNVIVTPHIAGNSPQRAARNHRLIAENLRRFAAGQPLVGVVDLEAGY